MAPRHNFVVVDMGASDGGASDLVFVETRLAELFTAARPSAELLRLLGELPDVFVGVAAQLELIVNVFSEALSASFKEQGLPLPPWRRRDALLAHWSISSPLDYPGDAELRIGPLVPLNEGHTCNALPLLGREGKAEASDGPTAGAKEAAHHQGPVTFRRA